MRIGSLLGIALVVAFAPPTTAQVPEWTLDFTDAMGDLHFVDYGAGSDSPGRVVSGPGWMDVTALRARVDGHELVLQVESAGEWSSMVDATSPLFDDASADDELDSYLSDLFRPAIQVWLFGPTSQAAQWFMVYPGRGWAIEEISSFFDSETIGHGRIDRELLELRVPRNPLVDPNKLALMLSIHKDDHLLEVDDGGSGVGGSISEVVPSSDDDHEPLALMLDGSIVTWPSFDQTPIPEGEIADAVLRKTVAGPTKLEDLEQRTSDFIEEHEDALRALPSVDGTGTLEAKEMFLGLLTVMGMEYEDYDTVEPNPEADHASAAAIGAAVAMFIAEQAASDDLRADAIGLAGDYFDTAASSWYGRDETASWVAGYLLGFAE